MRRKLVDERGYCYASNEWLSKRYKITIEELEKWLKSAEYYELIRIDMSSGWRRIYIHKKIRFKKYDYFRMSTEGLINIIMNSSLGEIDDGSKVVNFFKFVEERERITKQKEII